MLFHKLLPYAFFPVTWLVMLLLVVILLLWRARTRAALRVVMATLVLLLITSSPLVANSLWGALERQFPPQTPQQLPASGAIVLLAGGVELMAPPRVMPELNDAADRLWFAAELYHAGKAPLIVVSGGQVFPNPGLLSEADYHVQFLRRMGVPGDAILLETGSSNTADNAVLTAKMLAERNISEVLLVTSAMHMPRANLLFQQVGLQVIPAPCDVHVSTVNEPAIFGMLPNAESFAITQAALREWLGLAFYRLRAVGS